MELPAPDRFAGSLLGQCLADAVGLLMADRQGVTCRQFCDQHLRTWWDEFQSRDAPAALPYSEPAQLAVLIVDCFLERGSFDPSDFAAGLAALVQRRQVVRRSWPTYKAADNLARGAAWHDAGIDSPANGAAARAAPLGLLLFGRPDEIRLAATRQGWVTHQNAQAAAGAIIAGEAVAILIGADAVDPPRLLAYLADRVRSLDKEFSQRLLQLGGWLELPLEEARARICATAPADPFANAPDGLPTHVVPTVLWSLYSFFRAPGDFTQALICAVCPGGDVSPSACLAGAFCGAYLGLSSLPQAACRRLTNGGEPVFEALLARGQACRRLAGSQA